MVHFAPVKMSTAELHAAPVLPAQLVPATLPSEFWHTVPFHWQTPVPATHLHIAVPGSHLHCLTLSRQVQLPVPSCHRHGEPASSFCSEQFSAVVSRSPQKAPPSALRHVALVIVSTRRLQADAFVPTRAHTPGVTLPSELRQTALTNASVCQFSGPRTLMMPWRGMAPVEVNATLAFAITPGERGSEVH